MKSFWLVAVSTMTASAVAMAQSTVTLYGVIDESLLVSTNSNGGRVLRLSDNGIRGNRIGLIGTEDLGDGKAAIFRLENGFNATTGSMGQGGRLFGSQALVGVTGNSGTVLAGRQINTDASLIAVNFAAATQWAGVLAAHPGDVDNLYDTFRVPGALKYIAPKIGGFDFQALYAPGGVAGNGPRAQVASAAVSYSLGQIAIGASYSSAQTPNLGLAAGTANANTVTVPPGANYTSPVDSGFSSAHAYQVLSLGASYSSGSVTLGVLYTNTRFRGLGDPSAGPNPLEYTGDANFHNVELNGRYSISPALSVGASYNVTTRNSVSTLHRPEGLGPARYLQAVVGIRYILQKTVFVYLEAMMQHASGVDSTGRSAVAANAAVGASSSAQQSAMRAGLNVSF